MEMVYFLAILAQRLMQLRRLVAIEILLSNVTTSVLRMLFVILEKGLADLFSRYITHCQKFNHQQHRQDRQSQEAEVNQHHQQHIPSHPTLTS
jgi:hypothetical protein